MTWNKDAFQQTPIVTVPLIKATLKQEAREIAPFSAP